MGSLTAIRMRLTLLAVALAAGGTLWGLSRAERRTLHHVPILMYHKIGDGSDSPWWVTAADFEAHLQSLKEQGYRSVFPSDLVAHRTWGWPLPAKPVIITFDDGYLNTVTGAEPLLRKYGFRAVCYLITGQISDTPDTRRSCEGAPMLSWPEVRAAQRRGTLRFGGHTRSHANLMAMNDPRGEVEACYRDIRKQGGFKPEGFCYPFGQLKPGTPPVVAKAGFTTAVTCDDGVAATTPELDLLKLPRVAIMGGRHVYHVERLPATNALTLRVWKEGHAMQTRPRLKSTTPHGDVDAWLPSVTIDSHPTTLSWPFPSATPPASPVLEFWDDFQVLMLARQSL